jgi:hypothetical protein
MHSLTFMEIQEYNKIDDDSPTNKVSRESTIRARQNVLTRIVLKQLTALTTALRYNFCRR